MGRDSIVEFIGEERFGGYLQRIAQLVSDGGQFNKECEKLVSKVWP